jgi:formylglycine-generating enzyme required for sulfatase activity
MGEVFERVVRAVMVPEWAPGWAEVFGEDRWGVFAEFSVGGVKFVMRWIQPGRFLMGSPEGEEGRRNGEGPQHEVTITRGYWMGETPVTQAQWRAVVEGMGDGARLNEAPSSFKDRPDCPVESVSWNDCRRLVAGLGELLGSEDEFRLPTEAEWEYACRAGTQGAYCDGSACTVPDGRDPALDRVGWFDENSGGSVQPVKGKEANGWGLYDVHGCVWEWCRDARRLYSIDPVWDPVGGQDAGAARVLRGGSRGSWAKSCRAAYRRAGDPASGWGNAGLRLSAGQRGKSGGAGP